MVIYYFVCKIQNIFKQQGYTCDYDKINYTILELVYMHKYMKLKVKFI